MIDKMATGGSGFPQTPISNQSDEIYTISKPKIDSVRCGSCNHPTTEAKCRLFCEPCDMFICKDCTYHVNVANGAEERDDDYLHETNVTVGTFAKSLAESKKKLLDEQTLRCENIKNIKLEYREYLEQCVVNCQNGRDIFQKTINEVNYDLTVLHDTGAKIQSQFDSLKEGNKRHDALMLVKNRHKWKDYTAALRGIERSGRPRVCMSDEGGVTNQYPKVVLENYCCFRGIKGQDLSPKKVGRAWILHAGSLYLHTGGYHFWEDYYQSQIRPFVTLAEGRNGEVLVFLMQISGFVGEWSRNDIEMSGQPYSESITTDKYGSNFALGENGEDVIYVHRCSHISKVLLPSNCQSDTYKPVALCVDPERDLLCVYTQDKGDGQDKVYVFKIKYCFDTKKCNAFNFKTSNIGPTDSDDNALVSEKSSTESNTHTRRPDTHGDNGDRQCEFVKSDEKSVEKLCDKAGGCLLA